MTTCIVIVIGAVLVGVPLMARLGRGAGRKMRGNLQLAAIFLGLGEPLDPPSKHLIEAGERDEKETPPAGDPPMPGV